MRGGVQLIDKSLDSFVHLITDNNSDNQSPNIPVK